MKVTIIMSKERKSANVVWGICTNTSGYERDGEHHKCSKCENKEKQAVRVSKDFVCEECGEPLQKCVPPKPPFPKWIIIALVALVLIGGGIGAYFGLYGTKEKQPITMSLNKKNISLKVGDSDTLKAAVTPQDLGLEVLYKSGNDTIAEVSKTGIIRALTEGSTFVVCYCTSEQGDTIGDTCRIIVQPKELKEGTSDSTVVSAEDSTKNEPKVSVVGQSTNSAKKVPVKNTYNLGWGTYSGPMKGGKPHGTNGRVSVTKTHTITFEGDISGASVAVSKGETIKATYFENGRLIHGVVYDKKGDHRNF